MWPRVLKVPGGNLEVVSAGPQGPVATRRRGRPPPDPLMAVTPNRPVARRGEALLTLTSFFTKKEKV